jgi:PII-like signaling protein
MVTPSEKMSRLKIYVGEDKLHGELKLYEAILGKARQLRLAGATLYRGIEGYGHSARLHSVEILASEDLPVVIEIVDSEEKIAGFLEILKLVPEIGLITCDPVGKAWLKSV